MKNLINKKHMIIIIIIIIILNLISGCINNNDNNNNKNIITINNEGNYKSINEALFIAQNNDTIYVGPGTYNEKLIINKPIKLIGAGSGKTIIDNNDISSNPEIIIIESDSCLIDGFTITNSKFILNGSDFIIGIKIFSSSNVIKNNSIINLNHCISLDQNVEENIIENNIISNNNIGIEIWNAFNNRIMKNTITNSTQSGVFIGYKARSNIVSSNTFLGNKNGVRLKDAQNNNIIDNFFKSNSKAIYECCGAINNNLNNNTIEE